MWCIRNFPVPSVFPKDIASENSDLKVVRRMLVAIHPDKFRTENIYLHALSVEITKLLNNILPIARACSKPIVLDDD